MADVPTGVNYGRVSAYLTQYVADSTDAGAAPDAVPVQGAVVLYPVPEVTRWPTLNPSPTISASNQLRCPVIDGYMYPPGTTAATAPTTAKYVTVVATDQPLGLPTTVQWRAVFDLNGVLANPSATIFNVPTDGQIDLASVVPVSPEPGVIKVTTFESQAAAEDAASRAEQAAATAAQDTVDATAALLDGKVTAAESARGDAVTARDEAVAAATTATGAASTATTRASEASTSATSAATSASAAATTLASAVQYKGSLGTQNLNDVVTPGVYFGESSTIPRNYPIAGYSGVLEVVGLSAATSLLQRYTPHSGGLTAVMGNYLRRKNGTEWSPWRFIPSQRVDTTAGRALYTWVPELNTEQLIYGDTGWRDISGLLLNGWAATTVQVRRKNCYDIEIRAVALSGGASTSPTVLTMPPGFRCLGGVGARGWLLPDGPGPAITRIIVDSNGLMTSGTVTPSVGLLYMAWSTTDPWPTTLPGTALGTIPTN